MAIGDKKGNICSGIFLLSIFTFISLGGIGFIFSAQYAHFHLLSVFYEIKENIVELDLNKRPANRDQVVHFSSTSISSSIVEPDFNFVVQNALMLNKQTEYCQWSEFAYENCDTCNREVRQEDGSSKSESYRCNCIRNYNYVKSWRSTRVNSLFFDQPAAHHNPQRDPYPSSADYSSNVVITGGGGRVHIEREVVERIKGSASMLVWDRSAATTLQEEVRQSEAYQTHGFTYAGGGYFFSPYEISTQERLVKMFFQWVEGSILDFQFGDLVPSCTAGDIRVSYTAVRPSELSGLGRLNIPAEAEVDATLGLFTTPRGAKVGVLREGLASAAELMEAEAWDAKKTLYLARGLLLLWALIPARLFAVYVGQQQQDFFTVLNTVAAVAIAGMINFVARLGVVHFSGGDSGAAENLVSGLGVGLTAVMLAGVYWTLTRRGGAGGGLGAVWRTVLKWCQFPLDWWEAPSRGGGKEL